LHFTEDEQYLYYTHTVFSDGCAPTGPFSNLVRFDLSTGETTELVPRGEAYDYIVSPDGDKIAIIFYDSFVQIYDIASGSTQDIYFQFAPEPSELYMDVFWSPDNQYFLVEANIDVCILPPFSITYIYRINTMTLARSLLYAVEEPDITYSVQSWPEMDLVLLWQSGVIWHMNPWTGEITAETPPTETPIPTPEKTVAQIRENKLEKMNLEKLTENKAPLTLRPVGKDNWRDVINVSTTEPQQKFIAQPGYYLAMCAYGGLWNPLAVYLGDRVIGFIMWAVDTADQSCWLGGIFIDRDYQGQGYGRKAVQAAIDLLSEQHGHQHFALSYQPNNVIAKHLYTTLGFVETDEWEDDEIVARLLLTGKRNDNV
jgi:diamine N-acetyltransferase